MGDWNHDSLLFSLDEEPVAKLGCAKNCKVRNEFGCGLSRQTHISSYHRAIIDNLDPKLQPEIKTPRTLRSPSTEDPKINLSPHSAVQIPKTIPWVPSQTPTFGRKWTPPHSQLIVDPPKPSLYPMMELQNTILNAPLQQLLQPSQKLQTSGKGSIMPALLGHNLLTLLSKKLEAATPRLPLGFLFFTFFLFLLRFVEVLCVFYIRNDFKRKFDIMTKPFLISAVVFKIRKGITTLYFVCFI